MDVLPLFVSDLQSPVLMESSNRLLDHIPILSQTAAVWLPTLGEHWFDPHPLQDVLVASRIIRDPRRVFWADVPRFRDCPTDRRPLLATVPGCRGRWLH